MLLAQIRTQTGTTVVQNGIRIGSAIAIVCSWKRSMEASDDLLISQWNL